MKWLEVNLGQVLSLEYGSTLSKHDYNQSGHIPVVGSNGIIATHTESLVTGPGIVIGYKGSAGKISWIESDFWPTDTSFYVIPIIPVEMRWLFYLLHFLKLDRLTMGIVPKINRNDVYKLKILLPTLSEQRKIVEILDRVNILCEKQAETDKKIERILPALFINMFGNPTINPMGWPKKTLDNVIVEAKVGVSKKNGVNGKAIPVLQANNINYGGRLDLTNLRHVVLNVEELSKYELKSGDLLFNCKNSDKSFGKTGLWPGKINAIPDSSLIRIRVDQTQVLPEYVWAYMNTPFIKKILSNKARHSSVGMANINMRELRSLPIIIPPDIGLQQSFTKRIAHLDLLRIKTTDGTNVKLGKLFDLLLQHAFSNRLTAKWREEYQEQLQAEMEEQVKILVANKVKRDAKSSKQKDLQND